MLALYLLAVAVGWLIGSLQGWTKATDSAPLAYQVVMVALLVWGLLLGARDRAARRGYMWHRPGYIAAAWLLCLPGAVFYSAGFIAAALLGKGWGNPPAQTDADGYGLDWNPPQ